MSARQGDLFATTGAGAAGAGGVGAGGAAAPELPLQPHQLLAWQERVGRFQAPLFASAAEGPGSGQVSLFTEAAAPTACDPLALAPQPLSFWRWPAAPQQGAAIYLVIDAPPHLPAPLLLYVGETGCADRRWKGEHDCKHYLAAYGEALRRCRLASGLSIRFWCDVPAAVRPRRALEQALIRHWQPPFNKETRGRWATPFTAEAGAG